MSDYWTDNNITKPQAVVVCAACRWNEVILCSPRHWDTLMHTQYEQTMVAYPEMIHYQFEEGFINQFGEFLTRQEAMKVAIEAGQKVDIEIGCGGDATELYSEGLY